MNVIKYIFIGFLLFYSLLPGCSKNENSLEIKKIDQNCPIIQIIDSTSGSPDITIIDFKYADSICIGFERKVCSRDTLIYLYDFVYSQDLLTKIREQFKCSNQLRKDWDSAIYNINRINNNEIEIQEDVYGDLGISTTKKHFSDNKIIETTETGKNILYLDKLQNFIKEEAFSNGETVPYFTRLFTYDQNPSPVYNLPFVVKMATMQSLFGFPGSIGWTNNIIKLTNISSDGNVEWEFNLEYNNYLYPVVNHSHFGSIRYYYRNCYLNNNQYDVARGIN